MVKQRHLDGTGKGEFLYDYKYDTLTFKIKDRDYKTSLEFQNFIIDIDTENFVSGIRVLDASKVSGLNKLIFKNLVHGKFEASVADNVVTVRLGFVGKLRNRVIPIFSHEKDFTQQFTAKAGSKMKLQDAVVTVPEATVAA